MAERFDRAVVKPLRERCGHKQEKKGSWFKTIGHYTCPSCGHSLQMGYDENIRLFEANAHRAIE
jgi:transposase-like protein